MVQPRILVNKRELDYKTFRFPSGELGVEVSTSINAVNADIYAELVTPDDVFTFFLVMDVLRNISGVPEQWTLHLPYVPWGRQDRHTTMSSPFSLKVFTTMLNQLKFDKVFVTTPHSNVTELLINNVIVSDVEDWVLTKLNVIRAFGNKLEDILFIAPDAGAEKRVYKMAKHCGVPHVMTCVKQRDPATGDIKGLYIPNNLEFYNKHLVVIDDICDGGGTFIHLANELKKAKMIGFNPSEHVQEFEPKTLSLWVTHGIFSNGAREKLKEAGYHNVEAKYTFIEERLLKGEPQ